MEHDARSRAPIALAASGPPLGRRIGAGSPCSQLARFYRLARRQEVREWRAVLSGVISLAVLIGAMGAGSSGGAALAPGRLAPGLAQFYRLARQMKTEVQEWRCYRASVSSEKPLHSCTLGRSFCRLASGKVSQNS